MPGQGFSAGEQQIIIGKGVATSLKVKQGDWLTIMIPNSDPEHKLLQPKRVRLQVSGILAFSGSWITVWHWFHWAMRSNI